MDSTTAVLDSAIMDLTRRRLSMAMGGIPDFMPMSDPFGMNSMPMMAAMGASNSASSAAMGTIDARQQQLQSQQRELERRQKELELQRQQLPKIKDRESKCRAENKLGE